MRYEDTGLKLQDSTITHAPVRVFTPAAQASTVTTPIVKPAPNTNGPRPCPDERARLE